VTAGLIAFFTAISLTCILLIVARQRQRSAYANLDEDNDYTQSVEEDKWRGRTVYLTEAERQVWEATPRRKKMSALKMQQKLINNGGLFLCENDMGDRGMMTRQEALRHKLINRDTKPRTIIEVDGNINIGVQAIEVK